MEAHGQEGNRDAGTAGSDKADEGAQDEHGDEEHENLPFRWQMG